MNRLRSYVQPLSLTWWSGVALIVSGLLRIWGLEIPFLTPAVRPVIDALFSSTDPGLMIMTGLGFIGMRAKLERAA